MNRLVCIMLLFLAAAGCATQPASITHYNLPGYDGPADMGNNDQAAPVVVQVNLQVASYLSAPGIVYQTSELEVESAYGHRWAEPLSAQLNRILITALAREDGNLSAGPMPAGDGREYQLLVEVERFQGRYDGRAVIVGRWTLTAPDGKFMKSRLFRRETPLREDGYPALVRSLDRGWKSVCEQIAGDVAGVLSAETG